MGALRTPHVLDVVARHAADGVRGFQQSTSNEPGLGEDTRRRFMTHGHRRPRLADPVAIEVRDHGAHGLGRVAVTPERRKEEVPDIGRHLVRIDLGVHLADVPTIASQSHCPREPGAVSRGRQSRLDRRPPVAQALDRSWRHRGDPAVDALVLHRPEQRLGVVRGQRLQLETSARKLRVQSVGAGRDHGEPRVLPRL